MLHGGRGDDLLYANQSGDRVEGGQGNDTISGFSGKIHSWVVKGMIVSVAKRRLMSCPVMQGMIRCMAVREKICFTLAVRGWIL